MQDFSSYHSNLDKDELLRMNDQFAARYFSLLERFGDLPACDELIMTQLKKEFPAEFLESLSDYQDKVDLEPPDDLDQSNLQDGRSWESPESEEAPPEMALMRQLDARGRKIAAFIYQCVFDWCNIMAILIPQESAVPGTRIQFFLCRTLGNLHACMESLASHELASASAYCKRVLRFAEISLLLLQQFEKNCPVQINDLLTVRNKQLALLLKDIKEQLQDCQTLQRMEGGFL